MQTHQVEKQKMLPVMLSFDHLEQFWQQSRRRLKQADVQSYVRLIHAPLQDYQAADGQTYSYYACDEALQQAAAQYAQQSGARVLVVVDGPPAATGSHARYPALPYMLRYFSHAQLDFLMDDFIRQDEIDIVERWQTEALEAGYDVAIEKFNLEKGACLISLKPGKETAS